MIGDMGVGDIVCVWIAKDGNGWFGLDAGPEVYLKRDR